MIPKVIHYCWFGDNALSEMNQSCIASWRRMMPDFEIKKWNEANSPLNSEYCRAALAQQKWAFVADYVRLHALLYEGGIYFDTDIEVFKDFTPLLQHRCFAGFQLDKDHVDWVNNAVIGAEPGHPFIRRCLELTEQKFYETNTFHRSPEITTMALKELGLRRYGLQHIEGVTVFPTEYFYPYTWYEEFTPRCISRNTYAVHYWEKNWGSAEPDLIKNTPLRLLKKRTLSFIRARLP